MLLLTKCLAGNNSKVLAFLNSLLDSLPQDVAVVDDQGVVLAINERWAASGAPLLPAVAGLRIDESLFHALTSAVDAGDPDAARLRSGIQDVLGNEEHSFYLEYMTDHASRRQWFALEARRIPFEVPLALISRRNITHERERYAAVLQEKEKRERRRAEELQAVLDAAPIGLSISYSDTGDHIRGNPALERLFGVPPGGEFSKASPEGAGFRVFQSGRELDVAELPMQRASRGEAVGGGVYDVRRPDGRDVTAFANAVPLYDEAGRPRGAVGAFMDITHIKRAEEDLRESEQRFRSLVEAYAQAVWETDPAGFAVTDNRSWTAYTGQTMEEGLGHGWANAIHPDDRDEVLRLWRRAVSRGDNLDLEYRLKDRFGGWRWTNVRATPIRDTLGKVRKWTGMNIDIDARKKVEAALRASEERYRESEARLEQALATANAGVWELTPRTGAFEASPRALSLLGLRPHTTMNAARALAAVYAEDRPRVEAALRKALEAGRPFKAELRARLPDGSLRWLSLVAELRGVGEGQKLVGLVQDIDERKRSDEALRESEFRLQLALDSGDIGVYEWRVDKDELIWDDRLRSHFGLPATARPDMALFRQSVHPADMPRIEAEMERVLDPCADGGPFQAEYRIVTLDRKVEKWMSVTGTVFFEAGRAVRMVGMAQDVSLRKRAEIERQKFVSLAEQSVEFIGICDLSFKPLYVNPAGLRLSGLESLEAAMAVKVADFFFEEDQAFVMNEFFPTVLRDGSGSVEIRFRRFDTKEAVWMLYNVFFLRDQSGAPVGLATVSRDITSRKRAEEALKDADRRKDEFLATLAHELRNPLAPICNAAHVLVMDAETATTRRNFTLVQMIERQARHLVRLVDDLLEVSRITRGKIELKMQRLDLTEVLRHAIETAQPMIDACGHQLRVDLPKTPLPLEADPVRLGQVFTNLLNNAAKYTERGGAISLAAALDGNQVVVTVRDSGVGIPPDMLPHVFDLFTQVDRTLGRAQGGLGIGLALVKSLLDLHGGTVEAQSNGLGCGSAFVVRLPLSRDGASAPMSTPSQTLESGAHRILVVDDDHDVADSLVMLLETFGAHVRVAYGGEEGLARVREFQPQLILLDLGMPGMDGYETARRLRASPEGRAAKLVALTGWGQEQTSARARDAGFDSQLTKPAGFEDLQKLLDSLH